MKVGIFWMFYQNSKNDLSSSKQRFSIKKFKFGAASVLVGLTFLGFSTHSVLADTTTVNNTNDLGIVSTTDSGSTTNVPTSESTITATTADEVISKVSVPNFPTTGDQPVITVTDTSKLPDGKTSGTFEVPVTVTYPDGSTDTINVTVTVKSAADTFDPTATNQTVKVGDTPDAAKSIGNVSDLPDGTTFTYKTPVDTSTAGDKASIVVVKYPDGSSEEVPVTVTVTADPTQADTNSPVGKDQTVNVGDTPKAEDSIGNVSDLPTGTTFEYESPVDTSTGGDKAATVVVKYPDGSSEEVPVTVKVIADSPAITQKVTVTVNYGPENGKWVRVPGAVAVATSVEDPTKTYTFNLGTDGVALLDLPQGQYRVVYDDAQTKANADASAFLADKQYTPSTVVKTINVTTGPIGVGFILRKVDFVPSYPADTTVKQGDTVTVDAPTDKDGSSLPDDVTYTPGGDVTLPDGSTGTFPGTVTVNPDGTVTVQPNPDAPTGDYTIPVTITYPDGSTDEVPVKVTVTANPTQADTHKPVASTESDITVAQLAINANHKSETTTDKTAVQDKTLPSTGEAETLPFFSLAAIATMSAVGIALPKKKKDNE